MAYPAERKEFDPHFLGKAQKAFVGNWGVFSLHVKKDTPAEKAAKKYAKKGKPKIVVIE